MDTIFSSATNAQKSAIKIIRISGRESIKIPKIFSFKPPKPRVASLRRLYDLNKDIIDDAIVIFFPGPLSVTGEDIFEIHTHGSIIVEKKIYDCLENRSNFRIANRGEFTKRAFLNGKIDLTQAEGINDLINAETENQFKLSISYYEGALYEKLKLWRSDVVLLLSKLEALIDFSDEELPQEIEDLFKKKLSCLIKEMRKSIRSSNYGERIRNGFIITIVGKPNVGKSSLINYLSKKKIAIVTEEEGTTRDILEVLLDFEGFPVILNDTAGLRKTNSNVEKIGIKKALKKAEASDIILILSDCGDFSVPELKSVAKKILVHTKSDLKKQYKDDNPKISVKKHKGIKELIKVIVDYLKTLAPKDDILLTRKRHVQGIKKAVSLLKQVSITNLTHNPELAAEDLRVAAIEIGNITNIIDVEEILDDIFNNFCIGK
ncbi:tRNA uridine-5-carboxymethylaminomethyl(34) synthesis GTPase MnmE [Alphaproteobacteria bacterium]|nr:tRNA uridine-5-carboxymethylaminomethyl(34) synthesis GTPase MnmE [Alphaproteobacteria bacterium]